MRSKPYTIVIIIAIAILFYGLTWHRVDGFADLGETPTFHVFIATGGRETLQRMLNSLKGELREGDAVTVVFDGRERFVKSGFLDDWTNGFRCKVNVIVQEKNTGFWGHPIRNTHVSQLSPRTTFIMNADDDDAYYPGAFDMLRSKCRNPDTLYIAKMNYDDEEEKIIPSGREIKENDIGNPNGIIPFDKAPLGKWENDYTGDFKYYNSLKPHMKNIEFLDALIYRVY